MKTVHEIAGLAAKLHGVATADVLGAGRPKAVNAARQLAMWAAHRATSLSSAEIGKRLGGRGHSTVLHGVDAAVARMRRDPEARAMGDLILARIDGRLGAAMRAHAALRTARAAKRDENNHARAIKRDEAEIARGLRREERAVARTLQREA